jgi:hypothetical protein
LFTVEWEGPEAVEEVGPEEEPSPVPDAVAESPASEPQDVASEADSADSGDEYFLEADKLKGPRGKVYPHLTRISLKLMGFQRRIRRVSISSESSASDGGQAATKGRVSRTRAVRGAAVPSTSPGPSTQLKRKTTTSAQHAPPAKRKKNTYDSHSAADDPTRKYCLSKLQEMFDQIFSKYPHIEGTEKKTEDLTDDEKTILKHDANKFAEELEQSVFEIYSEPESGKSGAGGKYK